MNPHIPVLAVSLALSFTSAGCAEGRKVNAEEARETLIKSLPELKHAIVLLRTCQPTRPSGYNTIWANGDNGGAEPPHCKYGSDAAITVLQTALTNAGVIGVAYAPSGSSAKPVKFASFIMFREGIVTSGSSTSIEYHAAAKPCFITKEGDRDFGVVHRPITASPCRWFWEHDEG